MQIRDRSFLVTGGASGLGGAVVEYLVNRGARVCVADLKPPPAPWQETSTLRFAQTDVGDPASVQRACELAASLGPLSGAVNCAGYSILEKTLRRKGPHPLESFEAVLRVNLTGTFNAARLAAEQMAKNEPLADGERGVIVNVASIAAFDGQSGQLAYAASKAAVVGMTLPMARDLADYGIRVVTIAPGLFDTPLFARLPDKQRRELEEETPFPRRLGHPAEFAELVMAVIENPMLNGETIRLDGGIRMRRK